MDASSGSLPSDASSGSPVRNEPAMQEDQHNDKTAKGKHLAAAKTQLNTLPMLKILSIMRKALPKDANLDADVDLIMRTCVAKFTGHLISEAKEQRTLAKHRKLQSEDIISALKILGFKDASTVLSLFYSRLSGMTNCSQPQQVEPAHSSEPTSSKIQRKGRVDDSKEKLKIGNTDVQSPVHNCEAHQSPVHNSEPNQSPVHDSETYQLPVHDSETYQSPVHDSETYQSPVHNSEPHQSPVHNSELHQSPVHNSEMYQSPVHNSEPNQSPVHNFELHQLPVRNSEPHQSPVHNSESLLTEMVQLKGGGDVPTERALGPNEGNATMQQDGSVQGDPLDADPHLGNAHSSQMMARADAEFAKQVSEQLAEAFDASPVTQPINQPDFPGSTQDGGDRTTMAVDDIPGTRAGSSSGADFDAVMSDADLADAIELLKQYGVYSDVP